MNKNKNDNQQHKIDKLFKDKLYDRDFPYDETYWKNAEELLNDIDKNSKQKRRFGIWGLSALVFLILSIIFIQDISKEKNPDPDYQATDNKHAIENQPSYIYSKDDTISKINSAHKREDSIFYQSPELENLIGTKTKAEQSADKKNFKKKTNSSVHSSLSISHHPQENTAITTLTETKDVNSNLTNNNKSNFETTQEQLQNSSTQVAEKLHPQSKEENSGYINEEETTLNKNLQNYSDSFDVKINSNSLENIFNKPFHPFDSLVADASLKDSNSHLINDETDPLISDKKVAWSIGLHGGLEYITNKTQVGLSFQYDGSKIHVLNSNILAASIGISAGLSLKHLNFTSGINAYSSGSYNQYSYTESSIDTSITEQIITNTIYDTLAINIDTISIDSIILLDTIYEILTSYETDTIEEITYFTNDSTHLKTDTTLVNYIELPFLIGYQIIRGNWKINMQTGPSIAIMRFHSVAMELDQSSVFAPHTYESLSFTRYAINWLITPSVSYSVSEHLDIQLQPWLRFNLKSVSATNNISLQYQSYGLHAGIIYKF